MPPKTTAKTLQAQQHTALKLRERREKEEERKRELEFYINKSSSKGTQAEQEQPTTADKLSEETDKVRERVQSTIGLKTKKNQRKTHENL